MKFITIISIIALCIAIASAASINNFWVQDSQTAFASPAVIKSCGNESDLLTIEYIKLTPDPPKRGENLTIEFKGELAEEVPEGTKVNIVVKYNVVQLLKKTFDFCTEVQKVDETCPIEKGELSFVKQVELPKEIPPGRYTVNAEIITPEKKRVACLIGQTTFPR